MITIENLFTGYPGKLVLKGVNATFSEGGVHGLLGLNGSGKTTLLKSLYGSIKPESGIVKLDGGKLLRSRIGFLETESYFYHNITGSEYLKLIAAGGQADYQPWLDVFGLPGDMMIDDYSTGMKKKLAFTGVVLLGRPVLLLDEPFNGLDMESSRILSRILVRMKKSGKTVIVTSHILGSLTGICDSMVLLRDGVAVKTFDAFSEADIEQEVFRDLDADLDLRLDSLKGI